MDQEGSSDDTQNHWKTFVVTYRVIIIVTIFVLIIFFAVFGYILSRRNTPSSAAIQMIQGNVS
jgi:hypothetical protein